MTPDPVHPAAAATAAAHRAQPFPPPPALDRLTPDALHTLHALATGTARRAAGAGLDAGLLELAGLRVSQLNGCRFCVDLHTRQARAAGERAERLAALPAWSTSPLFSAAEQAALALCDAVTFVHEGQVPGALHRAASAGFDEPQRALLLWTATLANTYNRLAFALRPDGAGEAASGTGPATA